MAPAEEQALEIEALQSLFEPGREFETISGTEFLLKLLPFPAGEEENHVRLTLRVSYTPDYPDSPPDWDFQDVKLPDEKEKELRAMVEETINSSLGTVMIYSVAETCQDYLKANNKKALSMHEEMMLRMNKEGGNGDEEDEDEEDDDDDEDGAGEEEWKGLAEKELCSEEDRITPESFVTWKLAFDAEMIAAGVLKREEQKVKTGKLIFLGAKGAEDPRNSDGTPSADGGRTEMLVYDAALFGEEDDDDLEDLGDDGKDEV